MKQQIKVIAFDADDTLWENENYFRDSEKQFCDLLSEYLPQHDVERALLKVEIKNLPSLGYGTKAFIISMIETAMEISDNNLNVEAVTKIINIGKQQLANPVILIDDIEEVLQKLQGHYRLVMATKGDLLEQQTKLRKSGLEQYFHHTEIVSEKTTSEYEKLINHLDISPSEFLMIGNSVKSDILPVLEIGAHAWHIPYHTTWAHEAVKAKVEHACFRQFENVKELLPELL